jgi:glyoxylase-like metal-dependent hydrolase (beta-lactamase superfamily II)
MTEATAPTEDWTTPGLYEVARDVYRVPLPLPNDGLRAVNVYVVVAGDGLVCIDSGWALPDSRKLFGEALASLGCGPQDIDRFLVTHVHRDHYTQAISMRREFAMQVSLGAGERQSLASILEPDRARLEPQLSRLRLYGAAPLADRLAAETTGHGSALSDFEFPDDWLGEGEVTLPAGRTLQVVETPGHTRGHIVFHDLGACLLFAGDHVLPTITPSIGFEPVLSPNPLGDFLGSLTRVRHLPDAMLLPAHGAVGPSVHARVDELIDHHGRRLDETLAAVGGGAETAFAVARQLRWTRRERRLDELDLFNQMLAVSETGAHLTLLVAQGRVAQILDEGVYRYQLSS